VVNEKVGVVAVPEEAGSGGDEGELDANAFVRLISVWKRSGERQT
jgi:hypothetical protein